MWPSKHRLSRNQATKGAKMGPRSKEAERRNKRKALVEIKTEGVSTRQRRSKNVNSIVNVSEPTALWWRGKKWELEKQDEGWIRQSW